MEVTCTYGWAQLWTSPKVNLEGLFYLETYNIRYEQVMCDCEDICFIQIGRVDG